jgi:hypothetical protein
VKLRLFRDLFAAEIIMFADSVAALFNSFEFVQTAWNLKTSVILL